MQEVYSLLPSFQFKESKHWTTWKWLKENSLGDRVCIFTSLCYCVEGVPVSFIALHLWSLSVGYHVNIKHLLKFILFFIASDQAVFGKPVDFLESMTSSDTVNLHHTAYLHSFTWWMWTKSLPMTSCMQPFWRGYHVLHTIAGCLPSRLQFFSSLLTLFITPKLSR